MPLKVAIADGNWSNPATWVAGALPRENDVVASNGFTVTIDQNITVIQLTNTAQAITRHNPVMTSPTTPSGVVTSQPADNGLTDLSAWRAFDGSGANVPSWYASGAYPKWIEYEYASPVALDQYFLTLRGDVYNPRDWTFEAWDGTSWVVLHTVAAYTSGGNYTSPVLGNTTLYSRYRLHVTADRSLTPSLLIILEISFYEFGYTQNSVQGGGFIIGENVSIITTTTGIGFNAANIANGLTYTANSPSVSSFVGNLQGVNSNNLLTITGTGTLNIVGNITTFSDNRAQGTIQIENNATVNITGNLSYVSGNRALNVSSIVDSAIVTITGNVTIANIVWGNHRTISFDGGGTLNIIGTISHSANGSSSQTCIQLNAPTGKSIIFNHIGIITNNSATFQPLYIIQTSGTGLITMNLNGELVGGNSRLIFQNSNVLVFLKVLKYGPYGQDPLFGIRQAFLVPEISNLIEFRDNTTGGSPSPSLPPPTFSYYAPAAIGDLPTANNVRFGTTYGSGTLTGTVKIPHPNNVTFGVAVDDTFGNAVLTAASVWDYLVSNITVEGSIGMRLKNVATPQTIGEQLEAFLRLD